MKTVSEQLARQILDRIIADFGDGEFSPSKYVFEQITRLPAGYSSQRQMLGDAINSLDESAVIVLLDPHPNNRTSAQTVAAHVGAPGTFAFEMPTKELFHIMSFDECDMCITTLGGRLLIVGCHEDTVVNGEREVWTPIMQDARS
jgi:hypothetical protein